ncbi:NEDD4-binding protein 2 [Tachyglossus aculeatus]|uniref:NEDD4-binding protein 2 n=1 Tax=Tachyglossus aculeatus TaxID=9261 RepID=UPI0018F5C27E|nr:NEDD4-binding protein 2 [Tachyglossus aculeatus]
MPRKRRNLGGSPSRNPGSSEETTFGPNSEGLGSLLTTSQSDVDKEKLLSSMVEMFSDLDAGVVYMVLSECDFKVENAMDCLLELSTGADGAETSSAHSGFDSIAAALALGNQRSVAGEEAVGEGAPEEEQAFPPGMRLTEDVDSSIETAFEQWTRSPAATEAFPPLKHIDSPGGSSGSAEAAESGSSSSVPLPLEKVEADPGHFETSSCISSHCTPAPSAVWRPERLDGGYVTPGANAEQAHASRTREVLDQQEDGQWAGEQSACVSELFAAPKEFSRKSQRQSDGEQAQQRRECHFDRPQPPSVPSPAWNPLAPSFLPRFYTPVAASPRYWRPASDYRALGNSWAYSPPGIPGAWEQNASLWKVWRNQDGNFYHVHEPTVSPTGRTETPFIGQTLVLLRGVPGSGKTFMARALLEDNPGGVILNTDEYFNKNGHFLYDVSRLREAHEWNQKRAKEAFEKRISPIIIDNTNLQAWEMKPYAAMAQKYNYHIIFREPDTWWKYKPKELERRNVHGVSQAKIIRMLARYEHNISISKVLNSSGPVGLDCAQPIEHLGQNQSSSSEDPKDNDLVKENDLASSWRHLELTGEKKFELLPTETPSLDTGQWFPKEEVEHETQSLRASGADTEVEQTFRNDAGDSSLSDSGSKKVSTGHKAEEEVKIDETQRLEDNKNDTAVVPSASGALTSCSEKIVNTNEPGTAEPQYEPGWQKEAAEEKSLMPELLNFVGDWPVEQTMSQRVKRRRRIEKSSSALDRESDPFKSYLEQGGGALMPAKISEPLGLFDECESAGNAEGGMSETLNVEEAINLAGSLAQRTHRSERELETATDTSGQECSCDQSVPESSLPKVGGLCSDIAELKQPEKSSPERLPDEITSEKEGHLNERSSPCHQGALPCSLPGAPDPPGPLLKVPEDMQRSCPVEEANRCTQTESQAFALLWKIENQKIGISDSIKVLIGKSDGFKPKDCSMNVKSEACEAIPYRVMHDKSTHVEESELTSPDENDHLKTLCKLFGSFSFEALKDLYERCDKDITWTTSLLLDSETKLCEENEGESSQASMDNQQIEPLGTASEANLSQGEALQSSGPSLQDVSQNIEIKPTDLQPVCHSDDEVVQQAEEKDADAEKPKLLTGVLSGISREQEATDEISSRFQTEFSGLDGPEQIVSVPSKITLKDPNTAEPAGEPLPVESAQSSQPAWVWSEDFDPAFAPLTKDTDFGECYFRKENENPLVNGMNLGLPEVYEQEATTVLLGQGYCGLPTSLAEGGMAEESIIYNCEGDRGEVVTSAQVTPKSLTIDCLELALPPELALQLSELFGPVGVDSGSLTVEDCVVHIDLNLAKLIHEKWKDSVMERQRQDEVSFPPLLPGTLLVGQSRRDDSDEKLVQSTSNKLTKNQVTTEMLPYMDHWSARIPKVSLREIMSEEIAYKEKQDMKRLLLLPDKNCAVRLKEKQLLELYPTINQNFLMDIFKDHNYSLEQTVQFLSCVLAADPVKTVVAQETVHQNEINSSSSAVRTKEKKTRKSPEVEEEPSTALFQNLEYPAYDDYRAEAFLHQQKRVECLKKAREAFCMGMRNVATFYAQQGRLHEQKMKEANHLAAVEIFEKVNASLLPQNALDLHGLHVPEAIHHMSRILQQKSEEYRQGGGKPYLSVITGRGNHSLGKVARIKPAVTQYLTNHGFRFSEIQPGCLKVMLK